MDGFFFVCIFIKGSISFSAHILFKTAPIVVSDVSSSTLKDTIKRCFVLSVADLTSHSRMVSFLSQAIN